MSQTTKGRSQFLSSTGKSDTISAHRKAERGSEDAGISQRNAALEDVKEHVVSLDDILELFARGGAGELSVFFCKRYAARCLQPELAGHYHRKVPSGPLSSFLSIPLSQNLIEPGCSASFKYRAFFTAILPARPHCQQWQQTRALLSA